MNKLSKAHFSLFITCFSMLGVCEADSDTLTIVIISNKLTNLVHCYQCMFMENPVGVIPGLRGALL